MTSSLRFAAVALCVALAFTACTKSTQSTSTNDTTATAAPDSTAANASAAPDATGTAAPADASQAPAVSATTGAMTPSTAVPTAAVTTAAGDSSAGYITLPIYPNASEAKEGEMSTTTNTGSFEVKLYTTKDDSKAVSDWYKAHLPSSFQAMVITANGKTVGTFTDEHKSDNGDQAVLVTFDNDSSQTRIQLSTKHGK